MLLRHTWTLAFKTWPFHLYCWPPHSCLHSGESHPADQPRSWSPSGGPDPDGGRLSHPSAWSHDPTVCGSARRLPAAVLHSGRAGAHPRYDSSCVHVEKSVKDVQSCNTQAPLAFLTSGGMKNIDFCSASKHLGCVNVTRWSPEIQT